MKLRPGPVFLFTRLPAALLMAAASGRPAFRRDLSGQKFRGSRTIALGLIAGQLAWGLPSARGSLTRHLCALPPLIAQTERPADALRNTIERRVEAGLEEALRADENPERPAPNAAGLEEGGKKEVDAFRALIRKRASGIPQKELTESRLGHILQSQDSESAIRRSFGSKGLQRFQGGVLSAFRELRQKGRRESVPAQPTGDLIETTSSGIAITRSAGRGSELPAQPSAITDPMARWAIQDLSGALQRFAQSDFSDLSPLRETGGLLPEESQRQAWAAAVNQMERFLDEIAAPTLPEAEAPMNLEVSARLIVWLNEHWFNRSEHNLFFFPTILDVGAPQEIFRSLAIGRIEERRRYTLVGRPVSVYFIRTLYAPRQVSALPFGFLPPDTIFLRLDLLSEIAENPWHAPQLLRLPPEYVERRLGLDPPLFRAQNEINVLLGKSYPHQHAFLSVVTELALLEELGHVLFHFLTEAASSRSFPVMNDAFLEGFIRTQLSSGGVLRQIHANPFPGAAPNDPRTAFNQRHLAAVFLEMAGQLIAALTEADPRATLGDWIGNLANRRGRGGDPHIGAVAFAIGLLGTQLDIPEAVPLSPDNWTTYDEQEPLGRVTLQLAQRPFEEIRAGLLAILEREYGPELVRHLREPPFPAIDANGVRTTGIRSIPEPAAGLEGDQPGGVSRRDFLRAGSAALLGGMGAAAAGSAGYMGGYTGPVLLNKTDFDIRKVGVQQRAINPRHYQPLRMGRMQPAQPGGNPILETGSPEWVHYELPIGSPAVFTVPLNLSESEGEIPKEEFGGGPLATELYDLLEVRFTPTGIDNVNEFEITAVTEYPIGDDALGTVTGPHRTLYPGPNPFYLELVGDARETFGKIHALRITLTPEDPAQPISFSFRAYAMRSGPYDEARKAWKTLLGRQRFWSFVLGMAGVVAGGAVGAGIALRRPSDSPAAGLEELTRREFLGRVATGLGVGFFGPQAGQLVRGEEPQIPFLPRDRVPEPWSQFFQSDSSRRPVPFYGSEDYYRVKSPVWAFQLPTTMAIAPDGRVIGKTASENLIYSQRIADPVTGGLLGAFDRFFRGSGFHIFDRYGEPKVEVSLIPPEGEPRPEFPEGTDPIYRVLERDERQRLKRAELIGYLKGELLLDKEERPIARLKPVDFISEGRIEPTAEAKRHLAYLDGQSLVTRLMTAPPSRELAQELRERLEALNPTSLEGKLVKVDLARRFIQVDLRLGPEGSGRFARMGIRPEEARRIAEELEKVPPGDLGDLNRAETRNLLWVAIGNAHPIYRLHAEAVQVAGLRDDTEVLSHTISVLDGLRSGQPPPFGVTPLSWRSSWDAVLADSLRYMAIRKPEEAAQFMQDRKPLAEPGRQERYRAGGLPVSEEFPRIRARGPVEKFDRAIQQATALQRAGYPVMFVSLLKEVRVDEFTKTKQRNYLVVVRDGYGRPPVVVLGPEEILSPLGTRVAEGVYRLESFHRLRPLLEREAEYEVSMKDLPNVTGSVAAWSELLQKGMEERWDKAGRDFPSGWEFLDLQNARFLPIVREFLERGRKDLFEKGQLVFAQVARQAKMWVSRWEVDEATGIRFEEPIPPDRLLENPELTPHRGTAGHAFRLLPRKMGAGLRRVGFSTKPFIARTLNARIAQGGEVSIEEIHRDVSTHGGTGEISLSNVWGSTAPVHEIVHAWGLARGEQFTVGGWSGTVTDLFNEISWEWDPARGAWIRRTGDRVNLADYGHEYGATNELEDMAITGSERYVDEAQRFRWQVWEELEKGNLVPAVKYLSMKYLGFLDRDGLSVEYSLWPESPSFTLEEFERAVRKLEEKGPLSAEQQRLLTLVNRIREIWKQSRESGRIVQLAPAVSAVTAGLEERRATEARLLKRWHGWRSLAPEVPWVVAGPTASEHPLIQALAGLEERLVRDRGGEETVGAVTHLISREVYSVRYLGGLEEAAHFRRVAEPALIAVTAQSLSETALLQIVEAFGIPREVAAAGLEEFAAGLEALAPEA